MPETFLLVDFENVRDVPLSRAPAEWQIRIFMGRLQNSVPFALAEEAQAFGSRLKWIKIEGDGRNNLDFHLAYYMGQLAAMHPQSAFVILSRDKGFDALIAHVARSGISCMRVATLTERTSPPLQIDDPHLSRLVEVLSKIEKKSRPRRRKTLLQLAASVFQKKLPEAEIQRIVSQLFSDNRVSESTNALTYHF